MVITPEYLVIIILFIVYYFAVLIFERKVISEPREIIEKFLEVILFYAAVSIIYFSITGKTLPISTAENYNIYLFIIGFVALLLTIPPLLSEFGFFRRFLKRKARKKRRR